MMPWLWLNESASLVAQRLADEQPSVYASSAAALDIAREQLLDQARRGALVVQGRHFEISEEPDVPPLPGWVTIDASYWLPEYRAEPLPDWVCIVEMKWEYNCFTYEQEGIDGRGYGDLKV